MVYEIRDPNTNGANDDNLTNQKFILDKNGRLSYLTGDIGRYLPGGDIEFIGRKDNQIKIRGYRIELGEVENVLKKVENIKDAIAVVSKEINLKSILYIFIQIFPDFFYKELKSDIRSVMEK